MFDSDNAPTEAVGGTDLRDLARRLGWRPVEASSRRQSYPGRGTVPPSKAGQASPANGWGEGGMAAVTVCTLDHLHQARALVGSLAEHEPELPCFVVLVDWDGESAVDLGAAVPIAASRMGLEDFPFLALKYSATDLCCALKPAAVELAASLGFTRVIYLDSDLLLFAPLRQLRAALDEARFLVLPHTVAPLPFPGDSSSRPTMGDLYSAGVYNAGLFALQIDVESKRFLADWAEMICGPGGFAEHQFEQHAFNWAPCFLDGVSVFRTRTYNVAYWNLHDRGLRYRGLDSGGQSQWEVDGEPLVAFHFSGFDWRHPTRLSRHDNRTSLFLNPSVAHLAHYYARRLVEAGAESSLDVGYGFSEFPSGLRIDDRMRRCFRLLESSLDTDLDPFTPQGESHYCRSLLQPSATTFMVPILIWQLFREREDLQQIYPQAQVDARSIVQWFTEYGAEEYGYQELLDRHRPFVPKREFVLEVGRLEDRLPRMFRGLDEPLGRDRTRLARRLELAGLTEERLRLVSSSSEHLGPSLWLVRSIWETRTDLKLSFPDPLYEDAFDFATWLETHGVEEHLLPPALGTALLECRGGRSLARVFSFVDRNRSLVERFPLAFVGEDWSAFAATLLELLRGSPEFDRDDIAVYSWTMSHWPWRGLELALEQGARIGRTHDRSTDSDLSPTWTAVLARDPRLRRAFERWRTTQSESRRLRSSLDRRSRLASIGVLEGHPHPASDLLGTSARGGNESSCGINLFGFFRSPIGLGNMSRGLATALDGAGYDVARNLVGNLAMERDLLPSDFVGGFRSDFDTNLFVSYPHLPDRLSVHHPPGVWRDRRNVAYLAWEQRDGSPYWKDVFSEFDQIWALSTFAARALSESLERPVSPLPCVVDFSTFPAPVSKSAVGLEDDRFTFLFAFDANSSIERKNPQAVVDAFARAFSPGEPVQLVLKVSHAERREHHRRLALLQRRAAATGLDIRFRFETMTRSRVLHLLSAADCYVSLHRAEGFGYTCAEAMGYGKPVIATGYSGNLDFMREDNSFLVDWFETTVRRADGPFQRGSCWAEPSVEHAACLMRQVVEDPSEASARGERAANWVRQRLTPDAVGRLAAAALSGKSSLEGRHGSDPPGPLVSAFDWPVERRDPESPGTSAGPVGGVGEPGPFGEPR